MPGIKIALAIAAGLLVLVVACAEVGRRQGRLRLPAKQFHRSFANAIAPYNVWASRRTFRPPGGAANTGHTRVRGDRPFMDLATHFPNHALLRDNWEAIRDEALAVCSSGDASGIAGDRFFTAIADDKWKKFYMRWYPRGGAGFLPEARALCPRTCALLDRLDREAENATADATEWRPKVHLAMFSILEPGGVILPHVGPFKGCLRYHLCLQAGEANPAWIAVDGQRHHWRAGEDVLFDDTYVHEVRNDSDETRIVLFCDVERRLDSARANAVNRWACETLGPYSNDANNRREKRTTDPNAGPGP